MGNAGRNGGEYYTPRPLIRAMIQVVKPRIGERIYDGACGSAGFLCESFDYLWSASRLTAKDLEILQTRTFYGKEKKSLAYVIAIMNMILHGIDAPEHRPHQHAHRKPRRHPGEGPLRRGARQSAVRRQGAQGGPAELPDPHRRDGVPVPPAFHQDSAAPADAAAWSSRTPSSPTPTTPPCALRKLLLESCNLHTVLDCPGGTFQGAGVKTVVLFFEKGAPTRKIWFYQLDPGRNLRAKPIHSTTTILPSS